MKLFDKLNKLAEQITTKVEEKANQVSKTYKEKGIDGILDQTAHGFDSLSKKGQDYYNNLAEQNKKIMDQPAPKMEDKIANVAAVIAKTTQTIVNDAVKATLDTVKGSNDNPQNSENNQSNEHAEKQTIVIQKSKICYSYEQLNEAERLSLDSVPLSIVLEELGAVSEQFGMPGKWYLDNHSFIIIHNKWFDFNSNEGRSGMQGAISLLHHIRGAENALLEEKELYNQAVEWLQILKDSPEYPQKLSDWMKNEHNEQLKRSIHSNDSPVDVVKPTQKTRKKTL